LTKARKCAGASEVDAAGKVGRRWPDGNNGRNQRQVQSAQLVSARRPDWFNPRLFRLTTTNQAHHRAKFDQQQKAIAPGADGLAAGNQAEAATRGRLFSRFIDVIITARGARRPIGWAGRLRFNLIRHIHDAAIFTQALQARQTRFAFADGEDLFQLLDG
jgi:hypothetical protein